MKKIIIVTTLFILALPVMLQAQIAETQTPEELKSEINRLDAKVENLESEMDSITNKVDPAIVLFLFAIFCSWWARHTNRDLWAWFFLGLFFNFITGLFLLAKNAEDKKLNK